MIIKTDEEGKKALTQVCNLAFKQLTAQAAAELKSIAGAIQLLPKKKATKSEKK